MMVETTIDDKFMQTHNLDELESLLKEKLKSDFVDIIDIVDADRVDAIQLIEEETRGSKH
jgi:hypothetical protein